MLYFEFERQVCEQLEKLQFFELMLAYNFTMEEAYSWIKRCLADAYENNKTVTGSVIGIQFAFKHYRDRHLKHLIH